ncbi:4-alpha-glucanotransferase [Dysgonomonas sp. PH5-45]|uniref:4-alpha-glucanotransferase n=1 Tax=unclassified Dysgonomonas TaxID=2630389 RepID=UPI00247476FA|nr:MULTISPECIES: 4-alpha-glucanotransferase [unclassified Dysgonomonas]MDH6355310.1 4-alpha-glucanotransferase [Dysgonomonas sp. PH5-45]MDH6388164.1 4-alpha-glucanotransferase [Dysgonomonas sp. PH5-37]
MKIKFFINYNTSWGQTVCLVGSTPELGGWNKREALPLVCTSPSQWCAEVEICDTGHIEYQYFVKDDFRITSEEWGKPHSLLLDADKAFAINDIWQVQPKDTFLYTSGFSNSFFRRDYQNIDCNKTLSGSIFLKVQCPYVKNEQRLIICGSSTLLGEWNTQKALPLIPLEFGWWGITLEKEQIAESFQYKFAIFDNLKNEVAHWEESDNHTFSVNDIGGEYDTRIIYHNYNYNSFGWKAAGISIPVFSLRTESSFGVGEFSDLNKLIDWAAATQLKIVQILPVNDTTQTGTQADSYPYNAVSVYALHPIYLGLAKYPLADIDKFYKYKKQFEALNALPTVDYEQVITLKSAYISDLFAEQGQNILEEKGFKDFYAENEEWLFPYACFSYLRDCFRTANYKEWGDFGSFNFEKLNSLIESDKNIRHSINKTFFTQYLLHKQLRGAKEYAHQKGVILKGDIPIGVSRNSVEAWVEPRYFNLDSQTGAPPDDFAVMGQNWGFPTYNWNEMKEDGYSWWKKRFRKMADYFDAYRIDHILGFFRIWEIPTTAVQGLLGYFSPALPFTAGEIGNSGVPFDQERLTQPYIHSDYLPEVFGNYTSEVIAEFLHPIGNGQFALNDFCDNQLKIKTLFSDSLSDEKQDCIREGLYLLCTEVLYIPDKQQPEKYHPRIAAQKTYSFKALTEYEQESYNQLYNYFFYQRHSSFWQEEAMRKLPELVAATQMLVCGEDLGMIPNCVPAVMEKLQILRLDVERMPKTPYREFEDLTSLPYLSVCTTSTHDMPPIRAWWTQDKARAQRYYKEVLRKEGNAPLECTVDLCWQIIMNHLNSPAMLAILPLQDWLAIDDRLKRPDAEEEIINNPANPNHYWQYRMHLNIEDLLKASEFNSRISFMTGISGRR